MKIVICLCLLVASLAGCNQGTAVYAATFIIETPESIVWDLGY